MCMSGSVGYVCKSFGYVFLSLLVGCISCVWLDVTDGYEYATGMYAWVCQLSFLYVCPLCMLKLVRFVHRVGRCVCPCLLGMYDLAWWVLTAWLGLVYMLEYAECVCGSAWCVCFGLRSVFDSFYRALAMGLLWCVKLDILDMYLIFLGYVWITMLLLYCCTVNLCVFLLEPCLCSRENLNFTNRLYFAIYSRDIAWIYDVHGIDSASDDTFTKNT